MKIIVIKFGGTSLDNASHRQAAIKIVKDKIDSGYNPVIVVSAMGRQGETYATDTLQQLLPDSAGNDIKDFVSNCGEMISAAVFASELNFRNIASKPLTGWQAGLITDNVFGASQVKEIRINRLNKLIERHIIPVISGFQGISDTGELTTLGRGGSEITAVLIAQALKAERLEIFKDVDGVFTANPAKVASAELIREINYEDLSEITGSGAKVVNNIAVQIAETDHIAIGVGNTTTGKIGTTVNAIIHKDIVSCISSKQNLALIRITTSAEKRFSEIFPLFSEAGIRFYHCR